MKRKAFVLIAVCLFFALAACKKECTHEFQSEITTQPSCVVVGVKTNTCTLCEYSYTEEVPVREHTYATGEEIQAPTCSKEGIMSYVCTGCGNKEEKPIPTLEHTHGESSVTKEATCKEEGELSAVCTVCGTQEVVQTIPKTDDHVYETTILRNPTCIDRGEGVNTCTICAVSTSCEFDLTDHTYAEGEVLAQPTCVENGQKQLTCIYCSHVATQVIPAVGHQWNTQNCNTPVTCTVCNYTNPNGAGHQYKLDTHTLPTETFFGRKIYICSGCGHITEEKYGKYGVYDARAVEAYAYAYAQQLGFTPAYSPAKMVGASPVTSMGFKQAERGGGQQAFIKLGYQAVDILYAQACKSPVGPAGYKIHITAICDRTMIVGDAAIGIYADLR